MNINEVSSISGTVTLAPGGTVDVIPLDQFGTLTLNSASLNAMATLALSGGINTVLFGVSGLTASGATLTPQAELIVGNGFGNDRVVQGLVQYSTITADGSYLFEGAPWNEIVGMKVTGTGTGTINIAYVGKTTGPFDSNANRQIAILANALVIPSQTQTPIAAIAAGYDGTNVHVLNTDTLGNANVNVLGSVTLTPSGTQTVTGTVAATIANAADVAQGSTADAAWTSGNGTVIGVLKGIATIASAPLAGNNGTSTIGGVVMAHDSLSTTGIAPVTTLTTLEVGHVLKAGPGNLYSVYVTNTGTAAGFLIVTNTTTVTANGTLGSGVIVDCIAVGSLSTNGINYAPGPPEYCSTGISAVFSSTAAPVVTQAGSCWFKALVV